MPHIGPRATSWGHLRPFSSSAAAPSTPVSPSNNSRELPESPRIQITPLEVSAKGRRSRPSSNTMSGKREPSTRTTDAVSSALEVAAVVAAVASSYADDSLVVSPYHVIMDANEDRGSMSH